MRADRGPTAGFALPLVLWALVVGSALLAVALFLILQEQRAGRAERRLVHTFTRAETGLDQALADWSPGALNRALPGPRDSLGPLDRSLAIRRLDQGLFLLTAVARDELTRTRLGILARVRPQSLTVPAALTVGGDVRLAVDATISGTDQPPAGSNGCPSPDSAVADIQVAPLDTVVFATLASQASIVLPGGIYQTYPATVGTACDVSTPDNWGEPAGLALPCAGYYPVVHVEGDLELLPGRGQGVLLVDGDLRMRGPYRFGGLVMVRGRLEVAPSDTGVEFAGAVFAATAGSAAEPLAVRSITYSKCLLTNALLSTGRLVPLRTRGWKALF